MGEKNRRKLGYTRVQTVWVQSSDSKQGDFTIKASTKNDFTKDISEEHLWVCYSFSGSAR